MMVMVIRELPHKDTQTIPQLQLPKFSPDFPHLLPNHDARPWRTEGKDARKWAENSHNVESKHFVKQQGVPEANRR